MPHNEDQILDIIERVSKSVVNISTIKLVHNIFYQAVPVSGMGSGTIIDSENSLILTNNHVVGGSEKINVTLWNNQVVEGTIVGSCPMQDVALIKIDDKNLWPAAMGDSDKLRVGQKVFAIGNPFGLAGGPSVTSGVISAINRTIDSKSGLIENLVQTDAAINPGNSGGPLVDITGKVVAINTAIIPYAQGIGFAIPINVAKNCTIDIITKGATRKPWLGLVGLTLSQQIAHYYGLPVDCGVIVTKIVFNSPADQAGLAEGDIITQINNIAVRKIDDLITEMHKRRIGVFIRLHAVRNGTERFFDLKLNEAP